MLFRFLRGWVLVNLKMKNKRGFMLGEYTLKIIIAVLCLLLLFYLLFSLYSNSVDARNLQLAESTLEELVEKMEEARINGDAKMILLNPEKWIMVSYSKEDKKPNQCFGNCICICTNPTYKTKGHTDISLCNENGVCNDFEYLIKKFEFSIIERSNYILKGASETNEIKINYENDGFIITKNG